MSGPRVQDFLNAGCELASPLTLFLGIYGLTNGKPCEGCAYDMHGSKCAARKTLFAAPPKALYVAPPTETVREEASRRGISISEVRRQRKGRV